MGFAKNCPENEWIVTELFKLLGDDGYGVRDTLLEGACAYLPEAALRSLVERCQKASQSEGDEGRKRHWLIFVELLAKELKDPALFEQTRMSSWGKLNPAAHLRLSHLLQEPRRLRPPGPCTIPPPCRQDGRCSAQKET